MDMVSLGVIARRNSGLPIGLVPRPLAATERSIWAQALSQSVSQFDCCVSGAGGTMSRGIRVRRGVKVASGTVLPGPGAVGAPVILLVEDDILVRLSTAELLRDEGYVVLEAVNAREALALLETGHPVDLVMTDVRMPGEMDGLKLSFAVKELRANLPVMLFSSHLPDDGPHSGDAFLQKPYQPEQLFNLVKDMVGAEWTSQSSNPRAS